MASALEIPARQVSGAVAATRTLPLAAPFAELFGQAAVQRGSTVGCTGPAAWSLAMALAAAPSHEGSWVGVASPAHPMFGVRAAAELGVALERFVLVADPPGPTGAADHQRWAEVVAAMVDGFDIVVIAGRVAGRLRAAAARTVQARLRTRGAVVLVVGAPGAFACDHELVTSQPVWEGLGRGHGVARARRIEVELRGRRTPRPVRADMWLPGADGRLSLCTEPRGATGAAPVVPLRRTG